MEVPRWNATFSLNLNTKPWRRTVIIHVIPLVYVLAAASSPHSQISRDDSERKWSCQVWFMPPPRLSWCQCTDFSSVVWGAVVWQILTLQTAILPIHSIFTDQRLHHWKHSHEYYNFKNQEGKSARGGGGGWGWCVGVGCFSVWSKPIRILRPMFLVGLKSSFAFIWRNVFANALSISH